jgi:hypothetical protein
LLEGKRVAVVIPAYNEEELLPVTIAAIPVFVDRIIVVDDASRDGTMGRANAAAAADERIVVIVHERNGGVGAAIVTGYKRALEERIGWEVVVAMDNYMGQRRVNRLPRTRPTPSDPIRLTMRPRELLREHANPLHPLSKSQGRRFDSCPAHTLPAEPGLHRSPFVSEDPTRAIKSPCD